MMERIVNLDEEHPIVLGVLFPVVTFATICVLFARYGLPPQLIGIVALIFSIGLVVSIILYVFSPEMLMRNVMTVFSAVFVSQTLVLVGLFYSYPNPPLDGLRDFLFINSGVLLTSAIPGWLFRKSLHELQASYFEKATVVLGFLVVVTDSFIWIFHVLPFPIRFPLTIIAGIISVFIVLGAARPLFDNVEEVYMPVNLYFYLGIVALLVKVTYGDC